MNRTVLLLAALVMLPFGAHSDDHMLSHEATITLPLVKLMAQACEDLAAREGYPPVAIAIYDQHVNLKLFVRQDGVAAGSVEFSQLKARSAAALGIDTVDLHGYEYADPEKPLGLVGVEGYTLVPGGKAIKLDDGTRLGGVGVSGASGEQDDTCAEAAVDAAKTLIAN
jgi:uncharacterized protein GlcG (DUF336 family)